MNSGQREGSGGGEEIGRKGPWRAQMANFIHGHCTWARREGQSRKVISQAEPFVKLKFKHVPWFWSVILTHSENNGSAGNVVSWKLSIATWTQIIKTSICWVFSLPLAKANKYIHRGLQWALTTKVKHSDPPPKGSIKELTMAWNKEIIPFIYSAFPPSHPGPQHSSWSPASEPPGGGGTGMKNTLLLFPRRSLCKGKQPSRQVQGSVSTGVTARGVMTTSTQGITLQLSLEGWRRIMIFLKSTTHSHHKCTHWLLQSLPFNISEILKCKEMSDLEEEKKKNPMTNTWKSLRGKLAKGYQSRGNRTCKGPEVAM